MEYLKKFRIPFYGLKTGVHIYNFKIDKEFLEHYQFFDFDDILAEVDLSLEKQTTMLTLNFELAGEVRTLCDRCGDELNLPIQFSQELFIKFGKTLKEESENVIVIPINETEIEISQYIYEFITFAIPLKKLHPEGKCNKETLKKLKKIAKDIEKNETIDPRWQELMKLKTDSNQ